VRVLGAPCFVTGGRGATLVAGVALSPCSTFYSVICWMYVTIQGKNAVSFIVILKWRGKSITKWWLFVSLLVKFTAKYLS